MDIGFVVDGGYKKHKATPYKERLTAFYGIAINFVESAVITPVCINYFVNKM